jgi:hypothetical protein
MFAVICPNGSPRAQATRLEILRLLDIEAAEAAVVAAAAAALAKLHLDEHRAEPEA